MPRRLLPCEGSRGLLPQGPALTRAGPPPFYLPGMLLDTCPLIILVPITQMRKLKYLILTLLPV